MGDGARIDKQAASNALAAWDTAAGDADQQFTTQSVRTKAALDNGSWIGDDDAGNAFKKQFNVSDINAFLTPGGKQSGQTVTAGVKKLGTDARTAIENSLASDEQQRQQMDAARKKSDSNNSNSSAPSSSAPTSSAAPNSTATGANGTAGQNAAASRASGTTAAHHAPKTVSPAKTHPELFKGPLKWGIEGSDGKWHPLPAHADLKAKEYQGPLQWGVEGSDGKWYPLPPNERPTSIHDRGPLMDLLPASKEPTATDAHGPLMHIVPVVPSEVVGHHGHSTGDPHSDQQWQGPAAQNAAMVNSYRPTDATASYQRADTHAAVTSGEIAPGQPTPVSTHEQGVGPLTTTGTGHPAPEVSASNDAVQQGVHNAAETAPGLPTPVEHHKDGVERPTEI